MRFEIGMADGQLFRVTPAGVRPLPFFEPRLRPRSMWLESFDNVFVGGEYGDLWRLRIGILTGMQNEVITPLRVATSSRAGVLTSVEGDRSGTFYVLDEDGLVERFAAGIWTEIFRFPKTNAARTGRVLVFSPGEALVVWGGTRDVGFGITNHFRITLEEVPDSIVGIEAAAVVPGVGQVIGDGRGRIFRRDEAGWREMPGSGVFRRVRAILPFDEGFLFAGDGGVVGQWLPTVGFCTPARLAPETVKWAVPFGDNVLLLGARSPETYATAVTVLKRR